MEGQIIQAFETEAKVSIGPLLYWTAEMDWEHKGLRFTITTEPMGVLCLAAARVPREGLFIRVRPFSAIGRNQEEAVELLQDQIRLEYQTVPDPPADA